MRYSRVYLEAFGYELAPEVVLSEDLEDMLEPLYKRWHIKPGQLESWTGIRERRFWDPGQSMHEPAARAGKKALEKAGISPNDIEMLIYGGVCRDNLEPATSCAVADGLGLPSHTQIFDVSNACLGVLTGMLQVANAIELGQIQTGMVVSCESSRQIVESTIERMLKSEDMGILRPSLATLTGGSGAIAVILTNEKRAKEGHRFLGGVLRNAVEHHGLCRWGPDTGIPASGPLVMETDAPGVLKHGVKLGIETFDAFRRTLELSPEQPDKVICHQVGSAHQEQILKSLNISVEKDFTTFEYLGNMGTVALPLTAAVADERGFLQSGDMVGFLGIGSGLNCMMLGLEW